MACTGVFDPLYDHRHSELRHLVAERNRDAILDPRTQELGTRGGFDERMSKLPWGLDRPHRSDDFSDVGSRRMVESIARNVVEKGYTAVLAPTHYIASANSPWLEIDVRSTADLRRRLDEAGAGDVPIFYSLAVSYETFRTAGKRGTIQDKLKGLPIDSLWIKVSQSCALTHPAVRNVVDGAAGFRSLGVPLVGDLMGGSAGAQRCCVRRLRRNLPRSDQEGAFRRRPVDARSGFGRPGLQLADTRPRPWPGPALEAEGGGGVFRRIRGEIPIRMQGKDVLPKGGEGHAG